jgi:hypothetical protein
LLLSFFYTDGSADYNFALAPPWAIVMALDYDLDTKFKAWKKGNFQIRDLKIMTGFGTGHTPTKIVKLSKMRVISYLGLELQDMPNENDFLIIKANDVGEYFTQLEERDTPEE